MVNSMTAFASKNGSGEDLSWAWEIRSVNGRGLDIKIRMPEGFEALEPSIRKQISANCKRGSIAVGLRLKKAALTKTAQLNVDALERAVGAVKKSTEAVQKAKLQTAPIDVTSLLGLPGVFVVSEGKPDDTSDVQKEIARDLSDTVQSFVTARAAEGQALEKILAEQIETISALCRSATQVLDARRDHVEQTMRTNIARVLDNTDSVDEARIAQELAVIAVKADVAEELDRLKAHVGAARELLQTEGPIGRKFDFLTQEFNREANTLCSKANFNELTSIGLDLKTIIDQMREQVQNVE